MKKLFLAVFLLCSSILFGQEKDNTSIKKYYEDHGLCLDSATLPFLYYKIYEWIGTKYRYAGETKKGIDCSGFVCEMYKTAYCIHLSGGSKNLWLKVNPINTDSLKEGDLLFFKIRNGEISHVGLYLGNKKFAHATTHGGVMISDMNEAYYKKYFFSAGRITNNNELCQSH